MNRASRAMLAVRRGLYDAAAMEIARGIGEVEALAGAADEGRGRTPTRALACLRRLGREIQARRPPTLAEDLQRQLREAVSAEDYERAARLRDRLHALGVPAADGRRPVQRGTLPGATSFIDTSSK